MSPRCNLVVRTRNGFVNEIDGTLENLDSIHTRTIDATLSYRSPPTGIGKIGVTANGSWLLKYVVSEANGSLTRAGAASGRSWNYSTAAAARRFAGGPKL